MKIYAYIPHILTINVGITCIFALWQMLLYTRKTLLFTQIKKIVKNCLLFGGFFYILNVTFEVKLTDFCEKNSGGFKFIEIIEFKIII